MGRGLAATLATMLVVAEVVNINGSISSIGG